MNSDIDMGSSMFGNGNFSFTMENTIIDSNLNSLCIELSNQGKTYKGSIKAWNSVYPMWKRLSMNL